MATNANGLSDTPTEQQIISAWYRSIGTGWRAWSRDKRSLMSKMVAGKRWATRRSKYGPTGQRERSYKQWRAERNKPAIGEDGREIQVRVEQPLNKPK